MNAVSIIPVGTVTFLFTDLEGSTRSWEQQGRAMSAALARHIGSGNRPPVGTAIRALAVDGDGNPAVTPIGTLYRTRGDPGRGLLRPRPLPNP